MKFSFASQRSNKVPPKGDQPGMDRLESAEERSEEDLPQAKGGLKVASIAWAIAATIAALGPIAWAIAVYLIEREKQRAQVELARLEMEAKKQLSSN
jgi:hypothetical protein